MEKDHSKEVEERIKAIKIGLSDYCLFFQIKENCIFDVKKCAYCMYAEFMKNEKFGLCKFKTVNFNKGGEDNE